MASDAYVDISCLNLKDEFGNRYQRGLEKALEKDEILAADESRYDRDYYADKAVFLRCVRTMLNGGDVVFKPFDEPFFWNEFKRVSELANAEKQVIDQEKWRKIGQDFLDVLFLAYNFVLAGRGSCFMEDLPCREFSILFGVNETMMRLEQMVQRDPDDRFLSRLLDRYRMMFRRSRMEKRCHKLTSKLDSMMAADPEVSMESVQGRLNRRNVGHIRPFNMSLSFIAFYRSGPATSVVGGAPPPFLGNI